MASAIRVAAVCGPTSRPIVWSRLLLQLVIARVTAGAAHLKQFASFFNDPQQG